MSKIYTRRGDQGMTRLADGKAISKNSELIDFFGCIDELGAFLSWALESLYDKDEFSELIKKIYRVQHELFELNSRLSPDVKRKNFVETSFSSHIAVLEQEIDNISKQLPPLKSFIFPGGGEASVRLHIARTVCRRAERAALRLNLSEDQKIMAAYLNRLSDWLYVAARYAVFLLNIEEIELR